MLVKNVSIEPNHVYLVSIVASVSNGKSLTWLLHGGMGLSVAIRSEPIASDTSNYEQLYHIFLIIDNKQQKVSYRLINCLIIIIFIISYHIDSIKLNDL